MSAGGLDRDEVPTDVALVGRLLAAQFPHWAALPLAPFASTGADNTLYRLGDDMVVRLPRSGWSAARVAKEQRWLPWLAPQLPVAIPAPLGAGMPAEGYPWPWSVYRWLDGAPPQIDRLADPAGLAGDLAAFVGALRRIAPGGGPPVGEPLALKDTPVRAAIDASRDLIDADATLAAWERARAIPAWAGAPVWVHGDLAPGNVLLRAGRLSAVIDFAGMGVGDPAEDVRLAWSILPAEARGVFRAALGTDDATWGRARGRALAQALAQLRYYRDRDAALVAELCRVIGAIIAGC